MMLLARVLLAGAMIFAVPLAAQIVPPVTVEPPNPALTEPAQTEPAQSEPAQTDPAQILTLDKERLFAGSRFGQAVTGAVEAQAAALTAENRKIDADLEAEERQLTEKRPTMQPAEFRILADAFDEKVTALRIAQDAKSKALTRLRDDGRKRFFAAAVPILAALMRDKGALAILSNEAVILSFDRIDMTDEAIARLDAALGDGSNLLPTPDPDAGSAPAIDIDPAPAP